MTSKPLDSFETLAYLLTYFLVTCAFLRWC